MLAEYNEENKEKLSVSKDEVDGPKLVENEIKKSEVVDLETKLKQIAADLEVSTAKLNTLEADNLTIKQQLGAEIEAHKCTKEQLEKALRDVKKKNVLSLEMEDYERSMKDLTTKMEENKKKIIQVVFNSNK